MADPSIRRNCGHERPPETHPRPGAEVGGGLCPRCSEWLEGITKRWLTRLIRWARALLYSDRLREAEDVVQNAFLCLLQRMQSERWSSGNDDREQGIRGFLFASVRNLCSNLNRKKSLSLSPDLDPEPDLPGSDRSPHEEAEREEEHRMVRQALLNLQPAFREVLVLRYQIGLEVKQISEILAIPEGTVKTRCHRGMRDLRCLLALL